MFKLHKFFDKIEKGEIVESVREEVTFSYQYFVLLFLSAVIATFGLILGNTAIIIGAMILSPIIWPIIGLSLGTVISKKHFFFNSALLLIISIVFTIGVAYLISLFSPFTEPNSEILLRTNPTFFDLIIALAAGIAAILILAWPKYANSLAGVAVAASVLPPICVTGIGMALGSPKIAVGSLVLFLTNTSSIIFVGIAIFAFLGFYRKNDEDQVRRIEFGLVSSFVVILLLSFQLIFSLSRIIYEDTVTDKIKLTLEEQFQEISTDISVDTIHVTSLSRGQDVIDIDASLKVPSDVEIDVTQKNEIAEEISNQIGKEINLELKILPILKVISEGENDKETEEEQFVTFVQESITNKAQQVSPNVIIESIKLSTRENDTIKKYVVDAEIQLPEGVVLTRGDKEDMMFEIIQKLQRPVELNIKIIRFSLL